MPPNTFTQGDHAALPDDYQGELYFYRVLNNAGVVRLSHTVTPDTIETTFAVNHLAYFLLTLLLLDRIRETPVIDHPVELRAMIGQKSQ